MKKPEKRMKVYLYNSKLQITLQILQTASALMSSYELNSAVEL